MRLAARPAPRALDCEWTDSQGQFLWVSNLYPPEDRPALAMMPLLGSHFLEYPEQVTVVILSGWRSERRD